MKHFRAAMSLEPGYLPARYNLEQFAEMVSPRIYAYTEKDCKMHDSPIKVIYGQNNIGHFERRK